MNNYSLTYIFVILLTGFSSLLGIKLSQDDIQATANVVVSIVLGLAALYGRYKAGGITKFGVKS